MRIELRLLRLLPVAMFLAACALGETSTPTPLPITLAAPPLLDFQGSCDTTKDLENWLQITSRLAADFQTQMNAAAAQSRAEIYDDVQSMAALREAVFKVTTPDCAAETQLLLSDTMSQAVTAFQAYFNGDAPDLGNIVVDMNAQIEQVITVQGQLLQRMSAQFQQQAQATTPP